MFGRSRSGNLSVGPSASRLFRRVVRPPTLILSLWYGFWIGVTVLHAYLFARRLITDNWAFGPDQARLLLSLVGCGYGVWGAFKVGDTVAAFKASPRKVLCVALLLVVGHLVIRPAGPISSLGANAGEIPWAEVILTVPVVIGITLLTIGLIAYTDRRRLARRICVNASIEESKLSVSENLLYAPLLKRPPPLLS